ASADVTGAPSAARSSTDTSPLTGDVAVSFLKRGPPKIPKALELLSIDKLVGETDEEYKVRVTSLRYTTVTGITDLENDMVDFYKQVLSAQSRGQLETFAYHILASRRWGVDHQSSDTALVTIKQTQKQFIAWNHPD
ncbi:MAG: hypothetical protein ACKPKO_13945, partial [Candidatus Fonsibacter sp.]